MDDLLKPPLPGIFAGVDLPLALGLLSLTTEGRPDFDEAIAVIHFALRRGVRIFDTADTYCIDDDDLHYGERLVRQALDLWNGRRDEVCVLTKAGLTRPGGRWIPNGRPEHLQQSVDGSLAALAVDRLFLMQLHARDANVPFEETLGALAELQQAGKVEHLGLCNVSPAEVRQAQRHFTVAAVQSELNLYNRKTATDGLVDLTREDNISLLAYRPLGGHAGATRIAADDWLAPLAARHDATAPEIALAAVRSAGEHVIPLVGATRMESVRSSVAAIEVSLDVSDLTALSLKYPFTASGAVPMFAATSDISVDTSQLHGPGESPEVVLLMGIPGAGKSELVTEFVESGYTRLNRDELGGTLDGLVPRLEQLLAEGQDRVVLDNTYPTRTSRAAVIAAARTQGVPVRCRYLNTPLHEAYINIVLRMLAKYGMPLGPVEMKMFRKVDPTLPPPQALARWVNSFEAPSLDEGFTSVEVIPFERRVDPDHTVKGLLLDVDGTLRKTMSGSPFPLHPDDVEILPNRTETLRRWVDDGYQLFFVSNQAGIALGQVSHDMVQSGLLRTAEMLDVPITEIVYCPHPHEPISCFCRKPMPGLAVALMQRHHLDAAQLIMVGDRASDAEFAAGIGAMYYDAGEFFAANG